MTFVTFEYARNFTTIYASSDSGGIVPYRRTLLSLIFVVSCASLAAARDLAVISNKANALNSIAPAELAKVCKAETAHWPDGKSVTLVMRAPSVPDMKVFLEKVYEMPPNQVSDLVSSANHGRASHPAIVIATSDDDLVNKVASIPGAIGVVDVYAINSSVQVLKLGGKLPLEPGYLLHGN